MESRAEPMAQSMKQEAREAEAQAINSIIADQQRRAIARAIPRMALTRKAALRCGHNRVAFVMRDMNAIRESRRND